MVVGGASVLLNYGFRESTTDVDAVVSTKMSIKEAINRVGDRFDLPNGWINSDFQRTTSYSPKLMQYSRYYKTFNQILVIRTIADEYLIAMKLMSMRIYKFDVSDIVGIIQERSNAEPITFEKIEEAVINLYGGWDKLPKKAREIVYDILNNEQYEVLYHDIRTKEVQNKIRLQEFEEKYDNVLNEDNIGEILEQLLLKEEKQLEDMNFEL